MLRWYSRCMAYVFTDMDLQVQHAIESNPARDMVHFDAEQILSLAGVMGVVDGTVERHDNVRVKFEGHSAAIWIPMAALLHYDDSPGSFEPESSQFRFAVALAKLGFQLAFQHMLDGGFVEISRTT